MKFKAVIFDLDGTLLDTIDDISDAVNGALVQLDCPKHAVDEYKIMVGEGLTSLIVEALPEDRRDQKTIDEALRLTREGYGKAFGRKTKPYDGITELLTEVAKRGVKMAILSNKPDKYTKRDADEYLSGIKFVYVAGAKDDVPKKSDPAAALEIVNKLGVNASECLFVGDSDIDMKTAVNAGMYPVGVLWGFRGAGELKTSGAKKLIGKPKDLLPLL